MFCGLIILLFLFVGMITFVVKNTQAFLDQQLASHSQDTATALGLTLTVTMKNNDLVTAGRIIDAIWDRGYYKSIEVDSENGAPLIERQQEVKVYDVPAWFIGYLHLKTDKREAIIMDGWRKVGFVKVESNPGFAYQQIWLTFKDSVAWFLVTALMAMILGGTLLYIILRPLRAITQQAFAICNQQFSIQQILPWTIDLRQVVEAMNNMSRRLKAFFEEQSALSEQFREQSYKDPVTQLGNRRYFDLQFDYLIKDEEKGTGGALLLIELLDFKTYNEKYGYEAGDKLLQNTAQMLIEQCAPFENAIVSHIKGADFAIILPNKTKEISQELATIICRNFSAFLQKGLSKTQNVGNIGVTLFESTKSKKEIISQTDMALRKAQSFGANGYYFLENFQPQVVYGAQEWVAIFDDVIKNNKIVLYFQEVQLWELPESKRLYETLMRIRLSDNEIINAGVFMPTAESLNQILALDKLVIKGVIAIIRQIKYDYQFTVNVSPTFLEDEGFKYWLLEQAKSLKHKSHCLILELPEYGIIHRLEKARDFFHQFTALGCKTSIDHYGKNFTSFSYLYNLKINYLKIDGGFTKQIEEHEENQFFVRSLVDIARSLDIQVIAEAVETQAEYLTLQQLKVDGVQGYFVHKPTELDI